MRDGETRAKNPETSRSFTNKRATSGEERATERRILARRDQLQRVLAQLASKLRVLERPTRTRALSPSHLLSLTLASLAGTSTRP